MTVTLDGSCKCGGIQIEVKLPKPLTSYSARACDCDYCKTRNVSFLSDPSGVIKIESSSRIEFEQQGSEQAHFLYCSVCRDVIAATLHLGNEIKGAVNANLLSEAHTMLQPISVSPQVLTPTEKRDRWTQLWSKVYVNTNS